MNSRKGKTSHPVWEYIWYALVTIGILAIGVVLALGWGLLMAFRLSRRFLRGVAWGGLAVVLVVAAIAGYFFYQYYGPVDLGDRVVQVIIKPGDTFAAVVDQLSTQGIIRNKTAVRYPAVWRHIDTRLVPGRYDFTGRVSAGDVLMKLDLGDIVKIKLTVYEGAPIWKVASAMQKLLELDSAEVMRLNRDSAFLARNSLPHLEGYLYPETYIIPWGTPTEQVIEEMVQMYHRQTDSIWPAQLPNGLTRAQAMVLASIIQAETKLDAEKPKVGSVYHNRLRLKMRLDADPTVIYGLGGLGRPLLKRDLQIETPYNTYMRYGLPPTPINSPGLAAIRAALYPDTSAYLYFVADGTGGHRFSRTNDEHNRARYEIRKARARQQALQSSGG